MPPTVPKPHRQAQAAKEANLPPDVAAIARRHSLSSISIPRLDPGSPSGKGNFPLDILVANVTCLRMSTVLIATDLVVRYNEQTVLDRATLAFEEHDRVGLR